MNKIKELKELAGKATPGPWTVKENEIGYTIRPIISSVCFFDDREETFVSRATVSGLDSQFIAACSPEFIAAMCEVVEAAERLASYVEECYPELAVTESIRDNLKALEASCPEK